MEQKTMESLGKMNMTQISQLRNYLLSQDVESLGLSADQAMGLLQAIEERDTRDIQPTLVPSPSVPSFQVPQQPVHVDLDMPKVVSNINRLFLSAFGSHGGADSGVVYQPVSELSAINERVQMLEMQRARILNAQNQEQQNIQSAMGDGRVWDGSHPKRRMMSNDETNFNQVQGFQGNLMQGGNQSNQMNQSRAQMNQPRAQMNQSGAQINQPRAQINQSGGGPVMNQSRGRGKMKRGGFANNPKQNRSRRKGKQRPNRGKQGRGGQQWRSPGRSVPREDSYGRRSPDNKDYYDRRSRSRESGGRDRRDSSNDRGHSYNRGSHDRDQQDQRDDQGYGRGRRSGDARTRETDSHGKRYHEHDDGYGHRSNDDDNRSYEGESRSYQDDSRSFKGERSYQDESQPYAESPRGDGYFRSESNDFQHDDQLDDRGDRHGRKRKHRDFDEGSWHADDRHDQEPSRRYSSDRDFPDQRFSDGDQPRGGEGHHQEPPFDYETKRVRSQERDERRWDDGPRDILDTSVEIQERWHDREFNRSGVGEHGPDDEFFLRQGEVLNPDVTRDPRVRYREDDVMMNPLPERRNLDLDLDLGRIKPIPLSLGLGRNRPHQPLAHRLGAQLPTDGFQRGFSGPTIPSKDAPVSARMQGFVMKNQTNIKIKARNFPLKKPVYQNKGGDITLANMLLKTGIPDYLPIKKPNLQNTKGADVKQAAGSVLRDGTPTTDQNKGKVSEVSKSKDVQAVTLTNKPRPKPLKPEANSIGSQSDLLETLELQGFLYHKVMTLWTCYVCNVAFKNGMAYKIHLGSKNHLRTYNNLQTFERVFERRKIAFALRNLTNHRTVFPEQLSASNVDRMYFCCECGEGYSCPVLEHRKTERHLTLEAHRKCCYLCNVYCSDSKALVKHQNSKLHIVMKAIKRKDLITREILQVPGNGQNKAPIPGKAPSKVPVSGAKPVSSKASDSSKTPISNKPSFQTKKLSDSSKTSISNKPSFQAKKLITSKATTSNKPSTPTKELSSDTTDGTASHNISGLRSERKPIKVTLKETPTPATVTDSGQSSKKDSKAKEEDEDLIGLDLVIPVTGFFCRCCSKFYNNKHMAKRNHCMTTEHKQKALAWFKSHGTANPQKKPLPSKEAKSTPPKPVLPPTKPNQSDTIIIIDDDEDGEDLNETSKEKQQPPQCQDKMATGEPRVTIEASLGDKAKANTKLTDSKLTLGAEKSKEDNGQVPDHAGKNAEGLKIGYVDVKEQHQPSNRPVGGKLPAVPAKQKSSKDSDLEDGEIISEGELSVHEQKEAAMEKMEAETAEQPRDKTEDLPVMMESGAVDQTSEGAVDPHSTEMEVKATDKTVQESIEPSSENMEVITDDQAKEETEELLTTNGTDQNVTVEPHIMETEKPAADLSVEVTDTPTTEMENMDTDQSVDILEDPPIREIEIAPDIPNSDKTTEPPIRHSDMGAIDLTVVSNTEQSSGETDVAQAGENPPSGGVSEVNEIQPPKEDVAETLFTADKDIDLTEDDLYADLVEHAPEAEMEESLESGEEQGNEQDDEIDDDEEDEEDTRFFIDEGTWEVRSEEEGSNDDGVLEEDDDEVIVFEGEEDTSEGVEENDNDVVS